MASIVLGPEHDGRLRRTLGDTLRDLVAQRLWHRRALGGSQEVEWWVYLAGGRLVRVTAETYVGLSVRGPRRTIERIAERLGRPA